MDETRSRRRGLLLILSSPSGAGKSTLTGLLRQHHADLDVSVSMTTRARRSSEAEGIHYRFVGGDEFEDLRRRGEFLEWAEVHGHHYGTPRRPVEKALAEGRDMLFDIDWKGTQQIVETMRTDVVSVFILPPSMAELKHRLDRRAEDAPDVIERRLANARAEIAKWNSYDYVLVNDDVNRALGDLDAILAAERLRRVRQPAIQEFVTGLLASAA